MGRLACVDLPAFPLQLLLLERPQWRNEPVAVVAEECPHGRVLWVNQVAHRGGVRVGMRYAEGLSLAATLRAAAVTAARVAEGRRQVLDILLCHSPQVEPAEQEPGAFWVNVGGLERLYPDLRRWGERVVLSLRAQGFAAVVVLGWSRFGSFAVARGRSEEWRLQREQALDRPVQKRPVSFPRVWLLRDPRHEAVVAARVPLAWIGVSREHLELLHKLGVDTVGALKNLSSSGLKKRFGADLVHLQRQAKGEEAVPLQPLEIAPPVQVEEDLEPPVGEVSRLVFLFSRLLHPLLATLAQRGQALVELYFELHFEDAPPLREVLRPATPTLVASQLLNLVYLRLESTIQAGASRAAPAAGKAAAGSAAAMRCSTERSQPGITEPVTHLLLRVSGELASREQLELFQEEPKRDLEAANRALARVRAELGDAAVVMPVVRNAHLPEARCGWKSGAVVRSPRKGRELAGGEGAPTLVRRIFLPARRLPPRPRVEPDGWLLAEMDAGSVIKKQGPYILSGGWWQGEIRREYYFAELRRGDLVWIYWDQRRRAWYVQGMVE